MGLFTKKQGDPFAFRLMQKQTMIFCLTLLNKENVLSGFCIVSRFENRSSECSRVCHRYSLLMAFFWFDRVLTVIDIVGEWLVLKEYFLGSILKSFFGSNFNCS